MSNAGSPAGRTSPTALRDRFRGLMVGTAIGDCLGRPVEGLRAVPDSYIDELIERETPLLYSDDTVLTMALAESLLACDGFSGEEMADRFVREWTAEPQRGYGSNVVLAFSKVRRGIPWDEAARRQFGGDGSYGNGGAMRVAPVALWAYPDLEETVRLAQETSTVTHTHPVGVEGAVIQAVAAHHALRDEFSPDALLADLDRLIETERFRAKMDALHDCLERRDDERARLRLGNWVAADRSVLTALYAFLVATDFETAIRRAIGLGGDTDTIGAMAGAVAGARWGLGQIPKEWLRVENYADLVKLADEVADRGGGNDGHDKE